MNDEFPKAATQYITDRLARMSRPAQLRVAKIAKVVEAWHNGSGGDYPTVQTLSAALGFEVNPREFKFAERLARYNVLRAAHRFSETLHEGRIGLNWN